MNIPRGYEDCEIIYENEDYDEQKNIGLVSRNEEGEISTADSGDDSYPLDQK